MLTFALLLLRRSVFYSLLTIHRILCSPLCSTRLTLDCVCQLLMQPHYTHWVATADDTDDEDEDDSEEDYSWFIDEEEAEKDAKKTATASRAIHRRRHPVGAADENDARSDQVLALAKEDKEEQPEEDDDEDEDEVACFAVFESVRHRGKPLAYDISGRPVAFDRPADRLKVSAPAAALATGGKLAVARGGGEAHVDALRLLETVLSEPGGSWCQEVELQTGDLLLADSSVLLCPHPPEAVAALAADKAASSTAVDSLEVSRYDELDVLRSCALERRSSDGGGGGGKRAHMLWLGLRIDDQPLKWWFW